MRNIKFIMFLFWGWVLVAAAVEPTESRKWNLQNVDILTVIDEVSKETGRNFIIDPRVKGNISIVSQKEMDPATAYQVFLSALQILGYTAIEGDGITKIIPDTNAKSYETAVADAKKPGRGDQMVVRVVPLKNISAQAVVPILRNLVAQQGHLAPYPPANVLIIADAAANVNRLVKVIESIENSHSEDIDLVNLEHATAADLVQVISQLMTNPTSRNSETSIVTLSADDHSNAILMSGDKQKRARIRALIQKLDVPSPSGGNTEVIYLKYQRAEDLVPALQSVSNAFYARHKEQVAAANKAAAAAAASQAASAYQSYQNLLPRNASAFRSGMGGSMSGGSQDLGQSSVSQTERQATGVPGIQAEPNTNALILSGPPLLMRSFKTVIAKLDIRRRQVLVEAVIVELSGDRSREFGINWLTYSSHGAQGGTGFHGSRILGIDNSSPLAVQGTGTLLTSPAMGMPAAGLAIGFIQHGNLRNLLAALSADGQTNVLSTPSLVAMDNQKSRLLVGQQLPFQNGSYASTANATSATPYNTIEYRDVALTLEFVPQITTGRAVQLDLDQQVNNVISNSGNQPITSKRQIKTSVLVNDNDILVLGGLMETKDTQTWERVPILGDIPLFGALFSHKVSTRTKTNLMVFIKPTILRDPDDGVRITGSKYADLVDQFLWDEQERKGHPAAWPQLKELPSLDPTGSDVLLPDPL